MDKNQEFYQNRNKYGDFCIPMREGILNYLIKEKFLSEFKTEEEKTKVLQNLGILDKLQSSNETLENKINLLQQLVNDKIDISQLTQYVTYTELIRRLDELKPQDEKSKGYYSSYEELINNNPNGEPGDWAIVNIEGSWYVYKFEDGDWVQTGTYDNSIDLSEYAKLSDLELLQTLLVSGVNIKTINGQSILGEGNIEIQTESGECPEIDLSDYVTKEYLYNIQNPLNATMSVSPSLTEYDGQIKQIHITCIAKKGNTVVTPDSIKLSYKNNNNIPIDGTYTAEISDKGITTFTAVCTYGEETATCAGSTNITLPTYFGFNSADSINYLNLNNLTKRVLSGISMTQSIQNTVSGSYLWIVSPYMVNAVATDQGFTYRVAMVNIDNRDGLYYYRSNSAVDISNLTYYIR